MVLHWLRLMVFAASVMLPLTLHAAKLPVWKEYTSEHFLLYSDRSPKEAKSVLKDFERFRHAALLLVGRADSDEGAKTQIYLFGDAAHYALVQPDPEVAGFYRDTLQGARMVVGAEASLKDVSLVLFHEYAHHITRSRSRLQYPLWYDEGFADVLASAELGRSDIVIGLTNRWRERVLSRHSLLSLNELFTIPADKDEEYWDRYYASAWIFMHYLQLDYIRGNTTKTGQLKRFLVALHQGADPVQTFPKIFGMSIKTMEKRLRKYAELRYWTGYKIHVPAYAGRISSRVLAQNEKAFLLGDLAYRAGQEQSALELLQYIDGSEPDVAPALSLRAILETHRDNRAVGQHYLSLAMSLDPNNAIVATNAAHFYWDAVQLRSDTSSSEDLERLLGNVIGTAEKALALDPQNVEAGRYLARSLRRSGRMSKAIAVLQKIHRQRPTDLHLNFELGKLLVEAGQPQRSRVYLKNVAAWDHSAARKNAALSLLEQTESIDAVQLSELDAGLTFEAP